MATEHGEIFKEINILFKNLKKLSQGQAEPDSFEYDDAMEEHRIIVFITPNDGLYKGARVKFEIRLGHGYPVSSPEVYCMNRIYHPNIDLPEEEFDLGGSVCINTLEDDWQPAIGLDGCVMSILFLFHNPNVDDPLSPVFGGSISEEEFGENVRRSISGQEVEGVVFDQLIEVESCEVNLPSEKKMVYLCDEVTDDSEKPDKCKWNEIEQRTECFENLIEKKQNEKKELDESFAVKYKETDGFSKMRKDDCIKRFVTFFGGCCSK